MVKEEKTKINKENEEIQEEIESKEDKSIEKEDQEVEKTQDEQIEQLEAQVQEYKEKLQRSQADFENFKKRSIKEKQEFVKYANEGLILKVLEAYEDLERALEVEKDEDLREGVELIYKKMDKILKFISQKKK
jgi:molecular chaperone GrpE